MPHRRKNQPHVDSWRAAPQIRPRRSDGDAEDTKGTKGPRRRPPHPPLFYVSVDSKGLQAQRFRKCAFHGTYRRILRKCVFQRSYSARRTLLVSLHFPKNLRGRAAEHRITDFRILIVSAKLLVGPANPSGTRKTSFALYYTAG